MIRQPELGRKIAEIRRDRGLTQEELVEKCNLNVRTLQRIEAGEVEPRKYTVNLILEALDASLEDGRGGNTLSKWPGQLYTYFIDLFNLKTNTMKKVSILSIMLTLIVLGIVTITNSANAQKENDPENTAAIEKTPQNTEDLFFTNFSCEGCFEEKGLMIGRDVKFILDGVKVNLRLIALDKETRHFNTGFVTGNLMEKKVELFIPQSALDEDFVSFTSETIDKTPRTIHLKGKAKLFDKETGEGFEADEIIITRI